jgi:hypothetical protein
VTPPAQFTSSLHPCVVIGQDDKKFTSKSTASSLHTTGTTGANSKTSSVEKNLRLILSYVSGPVSIAEIRKTEGKTERVLILSYELIPSGC